MKVGIIGSGVTGLAAAYDLTMAGHDDLLKEYVPHLRKINPDFDVSWIEDSFYRRVDAAQPIDNRY